MFGRSKREVKMIRKTYSFPLFGLEESGEEGKRITYLRIVKYFSLWFTYCTLTSLLNFLAKNFPNKNFLYMSIFFNLLSHGTTNQEKRKVKINKKIYSLLFFSLLLYRTLFSNFLYHMVFHCILLKILKNDSKCYVTVLGITATCYGRYSGVTKIYNRNGCHLIPYEYATIKISVSSLWSCNGKKEWYDHHIWRC